MFKSELEAKRAKIAQLRAEREQKLGEKRRESGLIPPPPAGQSGGSGTSRRTSSRFQPPVQGELSSRPAIQGVDEIFEELNLSERASTDSLRPSSRTSERERGGEGDSLSTVIAPVFEISNSELNKPEVKVESYSKSIQTDDLPSEHSTPVIVPKEPEPEPELEQDEEEVDEEEEDNIESEINKPIQHDTKFHPEIKLRDPEANEETEELNKFLSQCWKVIGRAISDDDYDILTNYGEKADIHDTTDDNNTILSQTLQFYAPSCYNRAITSIDWSTKFPELVASSHTEHNSDPHAPKGLVQIWNIHAKNRPEYIFHSQSDVLTVKFSPFEPNLIFGTAYNGQILTWDLRSGVDPILKSPLTGTGHAHPVYSLQITGTKNANNLITSSTDGTVCTWTSDLLAKPQDRLILSNPSVARNDEVSPTCLNTSPKHPTQFIIGTEDGNIYQCNRFDQAGLKAGLDTRTIYRGHLAPVTAIDYHSSKGSIDFGDYLLSSSLDWSLKLWKVGNNSTSTNEENNNMLFDFKRDDMVYDVQWAPPHNPSVFAAVDGSGYLELWDLIQSTEIPLSRIKPISTNGKADSFLNRPLNKLCWCPTLTENGNSRIAVGGLDGAITIFDAALSTPQAEDWSRMKHVLTPQTV